ncbi:hypothetical protein GOBAR_AA31262 [Gossypium barbadense]|uniref:DUF4283 domain-containing protein n=1 Tax=Gossypium barbadense TaxID=3634 RepID=A0A2P5WEB0_GOSBA|nr:hypothetical protein GOBAR_AA31262 [Gossypium barbadense]
MNSTLKLFWDQIHDIPAGYYSEALAKQLGKNALVVEIIEMGWDLSLRAQSRKARVQSSIWLLEGGIRDGYFDGNRTSKGKICSALNSSGKKAQIDPVLGFCLEGITSSERDGKKPIEEQQFSMDHDAEEGILIGEEGEKR